MLVFEEERLGVLQRNGSSEQLLSIATAGINDRRVDLAKVQSRAVAEHLGVERRLTIREGDREAERSRVELGRGDDVSDV